MTKKILLYGAGLLLIVGAGIVAVKYKNSSKNSGQNLYSTMLAEKRNIKAVVKTSGTIQIKDTMKIGSLVLGRIEKLLVEENDVVKKGQLLAIIDDGKADNDVLEAKALLEQAQADHVYLQKRFARDSAMHEKLYISDDAFDLSYKNMTAAAASVAALSAAYQRTKLLYEHKSIKAPENGTVISKDSSEGETATLTSPATIIYTIAKSLENMEIKLEVDENVIAVLKKGDRATIVFSSYPEKNYEAKITDISRAPRLINGAVNYYVTLLFKNEKDLFKPGMTLDAEIVISNKTNVLSVPAHIFMIQRDSVKVVGSALQMKVNALSEEELERIERAENQRTLWVFRNNAFDEVAVTLGSTDGAFYEIVDGIDDKTTILVDVPETDAMKEMFKKFFGKGL